MVVFLKEGVSPSQLWTFRNELDEPVTKLPPGSVVRIMDTKGKVLGSGFYNGHARLRLRWLTHNEDIFSESTLRNRMDAAFAFRRDVLKLEKHTNAYRAVYSEGDYLSGLIIDKYDDLFGIEYVSAGMFRLRREIENYLKEKFPGCEIYSFAQDHVQKQESFDLRSHDVAPRWIHENGIEYKIHPSISHKTGFYLDQRDNRKKLSELTEGKSVLDLFSFSGGFALSAKKGGATEVVGVDKDPEAIANARENAAKNNLDVQFLENDIFQWKTSDTEKKYDVVILDPAKQARNEEDVYQAVKRYYELNRLAISRIEKGGILVSCSCSGWVKEEAFVKAASDAAFSLGRELQVFETTGAASDHPFHGLSPQSKYLKVIWARV